jgi:hypothetical protein
MIAQNKIIRTKWRVGVYVCVYIILNAIRVGNIEEKKQFKRVDISLV